MGNMFSEYLTDVALYSSVFTNEAIASKYMANKDGGIFLLVILHY